MDDEHREQLENLVALYGVTRVINNVALMFDGADVYRARARRTLQIAADVIEHDNLKIWVEKTYR